MDYVVTFFRNPDQTGGNLHVFTWADTPEQASLFAHRQVEAILPGVDLYPSEPHEARSNWAEPDRRIELKPDEVLALRGLILSEGLKYGDPNTPILQEIANRLSSLPGAEEEEDRPGPLMSLGDDIADFDDSGH